MPHTDLPIDAEYPHPPITAVQSRPGDNLVVIASKGRSERFRAWGFQVNQVVRRTEFVNNLNEVTNGSDVAMGFLGESGHEQQVSSPGDDRLRISDGNEETIMELGIRVQPDDFLVAVKNPTTNVPIIGNQDSTEQTGGSFDLRDASDNDIVQGGYGGVRSQWTDAAGLPTTATAPKPDQGHIKIEEDAEDNHIRVGLENKFGEDVTPRIDVVGVRYHVVPVEKSGLVESMLMGDTPARPVMWGGLGNDESEGEAPDSWEDIEITGDDVRRALDANRSRGGA